MVSRVLETQAVLYIGRWWYIYARYHVVYRYDCCMAARTQQLAGKGKDTARTPYRIDHAIWTRWLFHYLQHACYVLVHVRRPCLYATQYLTYMQHAATILVLLLAKSWQLHSNVGQICFDFYITAKWSGVYLFADRPLSFRDHHFWNSNASCSAWKFESRYQTEIGCYLKYYYFRIRRKKSVGRTRLSKRYKTPDPVRCR